MTATLKKLHEAIKNHSEMDDEQILEAGAHGADAGWPGFTYTKEAVEFYEANEELIYDLLRSEAEDMGYDTPEALIATFGRKDMLDTPEGRKNLLAWFALEEVGHWLEQLKDEKEREQ